MPADFLVRDFPALKKPVFRLGLSGSFGLDEAGAREALETARYVFWTPTMKGLTPALRGALRRDRAAYVVATGPLLGFTRGGVRRAAERRLRQLGTDYLDVFQLYWLSKMSALTGAVQEELLKLRAEGKIRALGASIHDRPRAGRLAEDSILDVLMIRYNAAHAGAEQEIFPHLARAAAGDRRLHRDLVAKAPEAAEGLERPGHDAGRLLPLGALVVRTSTSPCAARGTRQSGAPTSRPSGRARSRRRSSPGCASTGAPCTAETVILTRARRGASRPADPAGRRARQGR